MAEKQWEKAVALRGKSFVRNLETYKLLTRLKPPKEVFDASLPAPNVVSDKFIEIKYICSNIKTQVNFTRTVIMFLGFGKVLSSFWVRFVRNWTIWNSDIFRIIIY